jgi:1-deoxy-D-xylulose-5-phosphate synthase
VLSHGKDLVLVATGSGVQVAREAAGRLAERGIAPSVVNVRRLHPLDSEALLELAHAHQAIVTVEDNALAGGFGSAIIELLQDHGLARLVARVGLPDRFVDQGPLEVLRREVGLTPENVARVALELLGESPATER